MAAPKPERERESKEKELEQQKPSSSRQKPQFSAYLGHELAATDIPRDILTRLASLGIQDVEQLVGAAAIKDMTGYLASYLGIADGDLESVVEGLSHNLSAKTYAMLREPNDIEYPLGALLEESGASSDVAEEGLSEGEVLWATAPPPVPPPPSVNHVPAMQPIQAQGARGTCVAFGATAMHEYYRTVSGAVVKLSEQFLYSEIKKIDGRPTQCGTLLVYAIRALDNVGQCEAGVWPYNPNLPCNSNTPPPANAHKEAAKYRVSGGMLAAKDVNAIKTALANNANVALCVPLFPSSYNSAETVRSGRIILRVGKEPIVGGHCMCLVGYQDDTTAPGGGYFIARNSWNGWGTQCPYGSGYGTIAYEYISVYGAEAATIANSAGASAPGETGLEKVRAVKHHRRLRKRRTGV